MTSTILAEEPQKQFEDYADRSASPSPAGEEELRFIRNFHDVFLSIGLGLFAVGLGIFSTLMIGQLTGIQIDEGNIGKSVKGALMIGGTVYAVNAAVIWGIGEVFARTRKLFLPAIVILVAFTVFVVLSVSAFYGASFGEVPDSFDDVADSARLYPLVVSIAATFAILAYYVRMKLPFAMGVGAASLAGVVVSIAIYSNPSLVLNNIWAWVFGAGLFLFILGIYFDARDPERRTRISDNGFWLHFFAAPLMFTAITRMVAGDGAYSSDATFPAVATLLIVVVFAVISLLINRRALLVAGLLSAGVAIGVLVNNVGMDGAWTAGLTLLLLGGAMVLLGGGWKTVRRILIAPFPKTGWIARVIPPETIID